MLAATFTVHVWGMSVSTQVSDPTSANCVSKHFAVTFNSARFVQTYVVSFVGVSVHPFHHHFNGESVAIALVH